MFTNELVPERWAGGRRLHAPLLAIMLLSIVFADGCSTISRRPVPEALIDSVQVVDMPADIRFWGDRYSEVFLRSVSQSVAQADRTYGREEPPVILSISSGGLNGAYTAGVLCGWTEHGTRPVFRVVTGVSIGAIIAPFAFLGSEYDDRLEEMARCATAKNIYRVRGPVDAILGDSLADNAPLARFVARYADDDILKAVAAEHAKGRRLFIATTNLDSNRPMIWDMGAIASSGSPRALRVFQQVIVTSAAAPILFPPSYVEVEHAGRRYDEMHVDGAVSAQFMLYGQSLTLEEALQSADVPRPRPTHYFILNRQPSSVWNPVEPNLRAIAIHSVKRLMQDQGVGDLWQAYAACVRDGVDFRLAAIPDDEELPFEPGIDMATVARLFERGRALARAGYPWAKEPPGLRELPRDSLSFAPVFLLNGRSASSLERSPSRWSASE